MKNTVYTTYKEIAARVTSLLESKNISEDKVLEWAIECETEWIKDYPALIPMYQVELDVHDCMVSVPIYSARILSVYSNKENNKSLVQYYNNGSYLILPSNYPHKKIYMDYLSLAIDEQTQTPLIKKGHEEACVLHVIVKALFDDFVFGRVNPNVYTKLEQDRNTQVLAAQSGYANYDIKDLENINRIHMTMLPAIKSTLRI